MQACSNIHIEIVNDSIHLAECSSIKMQDCQRINLEFRNFSPNIEMTSCLNASQVNIVRSRAFPSVNTFIKLPEGFEGIINQDACTLQSSKPHIFVSWHDSKRPVCVRVSQNIVNVPPKFKHLSLNVEPTYKLLHKTLNDLIVRANIENPYLIEENGSMVELSKLKKDTHYILKGDVIVHHTVTYPRNRQFLKTGITFDETVCLHLDPDDDNDYEIPERASGVWDYLKTSGIVDKCQWIESRLATMEEILLVHAPHYYNAFIESTYDQIKFRTKTDIYFNEHTVHAAHIATGSAIEMTEAVLTGKVQNGIVITRPPGHHAERNHAEGFCFFNNCAVAAEVARRKYQCERILIIDFDVHHGNGIQHIFENDDQIMYFSTHRFSEYGYYPGTGNFNEIGFGRGRGFTINIPFPYAYNDADMLNAFLAILLPIANEFNPELVIVAAGFDAVKDDPLGGCSLSPEVYGILTSYLKTLANGKLVMILEGGYNITQTAAALHETIAVLLGEPALLPPNKTCQVSDGTMHLLQNVKSHLSPYWSCMRMNSPVNVEEKFE